MGGSCSLSFTSTSKSFSAELFIICSSPILDWYWRLPQPDWYKTWLDQCISSYVLGIHLIRERKSKSKQQNTMHTINFGGVLLCASLSCTYEYYSKLKEQQNYFLSGNYDCIFPNPCSHVSLSHLSQPMYTCCFISMLYCTFPINNHIENSWGWKAALDIACSKNNLNAFPGLHSAGLWIFPRRVTPQPPQSIHPTVWPL